MGKTIVSVLATLVLFSGVASAGDWTKTNTALQLTWSAMHILDWSQTRAIAKQPDRYWERVNPILGKHPRVKDVDRLFALTLAGNAFVAYALPHPWREVFQGVSIGVTGYCISINFKINLNGGDWF